MRNTIERSMIPPQVTQDFSQSDPSHPTKTLFVKDELPNGFIFLPVVTAPSLNISRPSDKTTKLLAQAYPLPFPGPGMRFVSGNDLI